jgi:hypothetical protein
MNVPTLNEIVQRVERKELLNWAKRYGYSPRGLSRAAFAEMMKKELAGPDKVRTIWGGLTRGERCLVEAFLYASEGRTSNPIQTARSLLAAQARPGQLHDEMKAAFDSLTRRGILIELIGAPGYRYVVPRDLLTELRPLIEENRWTLVGPPVDGAPARIIELGDAFLHDVVALLALARTQTARLTRDTSLHIHDLKRLQTLLDQSVLPADPYDSRPTTPVLQYVSSLLRFALSAGLIANRGGLLVCEDEAATAWLSRRRSQLRRDALVWAANGGFIRPILRGVQEFFAHDSRDAWWSRAAVALYIARRPETSKDNSYNDFTTDLLLSWMVRLGLLRAGDADENGRFEFVSLTPSGAELLLGHERAPTHTGKLLVLPSFEVHCPESAPLALHWQLLAIADRTSRGPVMTYRLSKNTVFRGLKVGESVERVLKLFDENLERPLPPNVALTLREWAGDYGLLYFMHATLLMCKDEATAASVLHDQRIRPYLAATLGPTLLVVKEGAETKLRKLLELRGLQPEVAIRSLPREEHGALVEPLPRREAIELADPDDEAQTSNGEDKCRVVDCPRKRVARALCMRHYQAARRGRLQAET